MFIILENVGFNHPLKTDGIVEFLDQYSFGRWDVAFIDPANVGSVNLSGIVHVEVSEAVARAAKFGKANHEDKLGILEGSAIHEELMHASLEHHSRKPKVHYTLTEEDIVDQINFMKTIMKLELEYHYQNVISQETASINAGYKQSLLEEIDACATTMDCRKLMHMKFDFATACLDLPQIYNWGPTANLMSQ